MDVKDLRIGDIINVKALQCEDNYLYRVADINYYGIIEVDTGENSPIECDILDLNGVRVTSVLLSKLGAWYDEKKVEYIFTFKGGLRIAIRPQVGTENYLATRIGEYRPKYCRFTYLHEFQHWLWDMYRVSI
jgi:hypothetical protein